MSAFEPSTCVVVLTGGPCGGKSTLSSHLREHFKSQDYDVYTIPEVPTILFLNGAVYPGEDPAKREELFALEIAMINLQLSVEDAFRSIAASKKDRKSIIICDRGCLDLKSYVPLEAFEEILRRINSTEQELLSRYDVACHLVTTAIGAEEYYTLSNNHARTESPSQAMALDYRTRDSWKDHSFLKIVENISTLEKKIEDAVEFITQGVNNKFGVISA